MQFDVETLAPNIIFQIFFSVVWYVRYSKIYDYTFNPTLIKAVAVQIEIWIPHWNLGIWNIFNFSLS